LLLSESAPPGIKMGCSDLGVPAIGRNDHAACRLVLYDGAPMGPSFRSGHHLPLRDDNFSLSGSIAQKGKAEKTTLSDG
jgi:hypothetical protein